MESLTTTYDNIFLNQDRLCKLIDDYNQSSKEKLEVLGELIKGYIIYRGRNMPNTSPMSIFIFFRKTFEHGIVEEVLTELSGQKCPGIVQTSDGCTYISLY